MKLSEIIELQPYSLTKSEKAEALNPYLMDLTRYHYAHCEAYRKMLDSISFDVNISCTVKSVLSLI